MDVVLSILMLMASVAFFGIAVLMVVAAFVKQRPGPMDDWIDEHQGCGGVKDDWLLDRFNRKGSRRGSDQVR